MPGMPSASPSVGEGLAQPGQHDGADDGAEQRAQAADDRRQGDLDRAAHGEGRLGEEVVVVEGVPHARQRRQRRRDHDGDHLAAQHRHADRLGRLGVLADGEPVAAEPAFQQRAAEDEGAGGQRQDHVIEEQRPAAQVHDVGAGVDLEEQAARAAGPLPMIEGEARELAEGDGEQREVDAGQREAEAEIAHDRAGQRRRPPPPRTGRPTGRCRSGRTGRRRCSRPARHRARGRARAGRRSPSGCSRPGRHRRSRGSGSGPRASICPSTAGATSSRPEQDAEAPQGARRGAPQTLQGRRTKLTSCSCRTGPAAAAAGPGSAGRS